MRSFCDQKVFPFPKEPANADRRWFWFRLALCHCLCFLQSGSTSRFTSVPTAKGHAKYSASLSTFGTMCCSRLVDSFSMLPHNVRSVDWSECPVHHHVGSPPPLERLSHQLPMLALPTTGTLKPLSLIPIDNFSAVVNLYYNGDLL